MCTIQMALREPPSSVTWGLVAQRGPWRETANDLRNLKTPQRSWKGPGGQGGTAHAGHNYWQSQTIPDRMRTSYMPAPPGPSRYAQRRVVTTQQELVGGARLQRTRQARAKLRLNGDVNDRAQPGVYPDIKDDPYDYQQGLDLKSEAIKQELNINDDVPDLYPQAGAFERDLGMLAAMEAIPDDTQYGYEANQAMIQARAEETMDRMAGGSLPGGWVSVPNTVHHEENVSHVMTPGPMGEMQIVSVYVPPEPRLDHVALEHSIQEQMRAADYQAVRDQQMQGYDDMYLPRESMMERLDRRSRMRNDTPYSGLPNHLSGRRGSDLDLGAVFEQATPPRGTKRKDESWDIRHRGKRKTGHPSAKRKNEAWDIRPRGKRKTGHTKEKKKPGLQINTDVPKVAGPKISKSKADKPMEDRIPSRRSKRDK